MLKETPRKNTRTAESLQSLAWHPWSTRVFAASPVYKVCRASWFDYSLLLWWTFVQAVILDCRFRVFFVTGDFCNDLLLRQLSWLSCLLPDIAEYLYSCVIPSQKQRCEKPCRIASNGIAHSSEFISCYESSSQLFWGPVSSFVPHLNYWACCLSKTAICTFHIYFFVPSSNQNIANLNA
jgi:hypothetical protein